MKLEKIKIVNFRSIKNLDIDFYNNSRVLVGINEAGKSNILKAAALLSDNVGIEDDDIRIESYREEHQEEAYVEFFFTFTKEQLDDLHHTIIGSMLTVDKDPEILIQDKNILKISDLCKLKGMCSYKVDLYKGEADPRYFAFTTSYEYKVSNNIKLVSDKCPQDYYISIDDNNYKLSDYKLIDIKGIEKTVPNEFLDDCKISDLNKILKEQIINIFEEYKPETIYWRFEKENLLPSKIKLEEFEDNPNMCIPLMNMFELAGYDNIKESIEDNKKRTFGVKNLLTRVAEKATEHFSSIWNEYDNVKFELELSGDHIQASIKDVYNNFGLSQRSDGFQRFITFLLLISIKVRNKSLQNALLIVDEPEISLHTKGAKFLRDELSNIADNNYVMYSTHSPFMIDEKNIEKHYRVIKENEQTEVIKTNESDYMDEEVLYNAIGYSIFRSLKEKNIIFEGWRDKKLFKEALKSFDITEEIKNKFEHVGKAHAKGVISFKHITPILELTDRECIVISDNDEPAKKEQEKFNEEHLFGTWLRYDEIDPECTAITGEDFIKTTSYKECACSVLEQNGISTEQYTEEDFISSKGKVAAVNKLLKEAGITDPKQQKEILNQIKERLFKNLTTNDIEDSYYTFISKLANIIG